MKPVVSKTSTRRRSRIHWIFLRPVQLLFDVRFPVCAQSLCLCGHDRYADLLHTHRKINWNSVLIKVETKRIQEYEHMCVRFIYKTINPFSYPFRETRHARIRICMSIKVRASPYSSGTPVFIAIPSPAALIYPILCALVLPQQSDILCMETGNYVFGKKIYRDL